jgi:hypothetical protein
MIHLIVRWKITAAVGRLQAARHSSLDLTADQMTDKLLRTVSASFTKTRKPGMWVQRSWSMGAG